MLAARIPYTALSAPRRRLAPHDRAQPQAASPPPARGTRPAVRLAAHLALVVLLACLALPGLALATGQVGQLAADFTKTDANGVVHTLSQYSGKVVVLFVMGWG